MKIVFSPAAIEDLFSIRNYISKELDSPASADGVIDRIEESVGMLKRFPNMGALLDTNLARRPRYLVSGNYVIIYSVEKNIVYIEKVAHMRENYIRLFIKSDFSVHEDVLFFDEYMYYSLMV